jgi:ubiquinone/menaquinone biosynthesis C-methylase UbiE
VRDPKQALREIYRILKPSGYHIFTIPYNFIRKTRKRIALNEKKDTYLLPKKFHGDSIRDGLVYTEFGKDFLSFVDLRNTTTKNVYKDGIWNKKHRFYLSNVFIAQKNR